MVYWDKFGASPAHRRGTSWVNWWYDAAKAERLKVLAEREAFCAAAKDRMAKYGSAQRLYKPGPDGERIYLTDEELDVERANASRAVDQSCSKK